MSNYGLNRMKIGIPKSQAKNEIKIITGHSEKLSGDSADGYMDEDILEEVSGDMIKLKAIVDVVDYGVSFPYAKIRNAQ